MGWLARRRDDRLQRVMRPVMREMVAEAMLEAGQWKPATGADIARGLNCPVDGLPLFWYDVEAGVTTCKQGHKWTDQHEAQGVAR